MSASTSIEKIADWAGRHYLVVGALGTLMSLAALSISAITLWATRSEVVEHAHETSRNVAAVLVSEIARTVETSNNALVALAADLGSRRSGTWTPGCGTICCSSARPRNT